MESGYNLSALSFTYNGFRLRRAEEKDAQGFVDISADTEVMRYYGENGGYCCSLEDGVKQVLWCNSEFSKNAGRWIIVENQSDEYIGDIGFSGFIEKHQRVEIGYRLMRRYWGRGIVSAFIGQLIEWGVRDLGYNRIEALVDPRNSASTKVLLKNGFSCEGTLREYECEQGGFVDLEMYSLLSKDFQMHV